MVGRSALLTDPELRESTIERPCGEQSEMEVGTEEQQAWASDHTSQPLDEPVNMTVHQRQLLISYLESVPPEEAEYSPQQWTLIAATWDQFIESMGCMYLAARAYIRHWGAVREPKTIKPGGLSVFEGMVSSELMTYAMELATFVVKPMSMYPPVRSPQNPYSIVMGNPERARNDVWGDLVKGRIMLFSKKREHLAGPMMGSRLTFVTQKNVAKENGVKVRYISDTMIDVNERIDPETHHKLRVPEHADAIRRYCTWGEGTRPFQS